MPESMRAPRIHEDWGLNKKDEDNQTAPKRRLSLADCKTIKRTDSFGTTRRTTNDIAVKLNYKLSSDVISF